MNQNSNKPNERNWNDRNNRNSDSGQDQNQPQNKARTQDQQSGADKEMDRKREGQGNEIGARSEQLSPMDGGQQINPRGRVQEQGNEESSRRSPQNRQSQDMDQRNNS